MLIYISICCTLVVQLGCYLGYSLIHGCAFLLIIKTFLFCPIGVGTKYDLDFKSPNKSGQNFKSGEDMIEMYKELCSGIPIPLHLVFYLSFFILGFYLSFSYSFLGLSRVPNDIFSRRSL